MILQLNLKTLAIFSFEKASEPESVSFTSDAVLDFLKVACELNSAHIIVEIPLFHPSFHQDIPTSRLEDIFQIASSAQDSESELGSAAPRTRPT